MVSLPSQTIRKAFPPHNQLLSCYVDTWKQCRHGHYNTVFPRRLFSMFSWALNCRLVNPSYYPDQINSIAGRKTIISWFPFPRKATSKIDSSAVQQVSIAVFDCIFLPGATIRIKLLSLVQFSDALLLWSDALKCPVIHSSDISCLMELFLDGIATFPERETLIKLVGDKLYASTLVSSTALLKIKLLGYTFKNSSYCTNV